MCVRREEQTGSRQDSSGAGVSRVESKITGRGIYWMFMENRRRASLSHVNVRRTEK